MFLAYLFLSQWIVRTKLFVFYELWVSLVCGEEYTTPLTSKWGWSCECVVRNLIAFSFVFLLFLFAHKSTPMSAANENSKLLEFSE
jgi:hypothetical protein